MDFLLVTHAAGVLPPSRSYCHNRARNDSRATQPPQTSVCFSVVFIYSVQQTAQPVVLDDSDMFVLLDKFQGQLPQLELFDESFFPSTGWKNLQHDSHSRSFYRCVPSSAASLSSISAVQRRGFFFFSFFFFVLSRSLHAPSIPALIQCSAGSRRCRCFRQSGQAKPVLWVSPRCGVRGPAASVGGLLAQVLDVGRLLR